MSEELRHPFKDCSDIADEHWLLRRVMSDQWIYDQNLGRTRPSSAAFEDCADGDPMSTFWKEKHFDCGLDLDHILRGHENFYVARIEVSLVRKLDNIVHLDPIESENPLLRQPAHVLVVGEKPKKKFCKKIAKAAVWEKAPPDDSRLDTQY